LVDLWIVGVHRPVRAGGSGPGRGGWPGAIADRPEAGTELSRIL